MLVIDRLINVDNMLTKKCGKLTRERANETAGVKMGKVLALFPIMYLSGGTCVTLIMIGASTMKIFFQMVHGAPCPLSTIEWYLVFTCTAILLAQLPNLNSIAGVSLIGAITAVGYCALICILSVGQGRVGDVSYEPPRGQSDTSMVFRAWNALGIIAFAFRGHNLVLEIQVLSLCVHPCTFCFCVDT